MGEIGRILGLDYGDARIGVAISDPLGWTARGLCAVGRKNPVDLASSVAAIVDIVAEHDVAAIVIGYPKNMDNSEGETCRKVLVFKKKLQRALPNMPIELFDERLTTSRAQQIFAETNLARSKHQQNVDKLAAAIILQGYLDNRTAAQKEKNMDFDQNVNENFDENEEMELDLDEMEFETIVMTDDEGNEIEYVIIDEFVNNDVNYLIMIKAEDADDDEAEAVIFKQIEASDEEFVYEEIDEDEYNGLEDMLKTRLAEFDIDVQ
ncbi:MAG: Holliday junction resolvase RuvX [Defluviitaleaceae bacterium]|nr:Holliday junction resolvase RuvX [Defluviitaleaceae bacterium]